MVSLSQERILLVGDRDRHIHNSLAQVIPSAHVTPVQTYFDAIAELTSGAYTSVLASAEPIERRPESAVKVLRELTGEGRLLLFGHPTLEPISRKMLEFGLDDYIITPVNPVELEQLFGASSPLRSTPGTEGTIEPLSIGAPLRISMLMGLPLAEIVLDAMLHHPHDATQHAIKQINTAIGPTLQLIHAGAGKPMPNVGEGMRLLSHALRHESISDGTLHLIAPMDEDETGARHALAQLSHLFNRVAQLGSRHKSLENLAITDDLTGLYNGRYFRFILRQLIEKAKVRRFPVTLLLFDIDDFKQYNDRYGHAVGDEILRQTASLMRRCCREHDAVARISGDEFAVVFWEKEGPRQPREPTPIGTGPRVPPSVRAVCERFRRLVSSPDFQVLGQTGRGSLTISGGIAVFPYDAPTAEELIKKADDALMFEAKKSGKNTIFLVGGEN